MYCRYCNKMLFEAVQSIAWQHIYYKYVCMYVYVYICIYVYMYICIHTTPVAADPVVRQVRPAQSALVRGCEILFQVLFFISP